MTPKGDNAEDTVEKLISLINAVDELSKKARKGRKSLAGDNFYGNKFDSLVVEVNQLGKTILKAAKASGGDSSLVAQLNDGLNVIVSADSTPKDRAASRKALTVLLKSEVAPLLKGLEVDPTPKTEQVVPMSIVEGTRGYVERVALQVNGTYERGWYDACAVMIRRLVETFIIETFEAHNLAEKIQDANRDFLQLGDLIARTLSEKSWNLSRNTKRALPELKDIGDLSAHNRRYLAHKGDIDKITTGLRVVVQELVHLSGLK